MRTQYTDAEIDAIEFQEIYNYSDSLNRAGRAEFVKKVKSNKQKGYTPPENESKKYIYGILVFATGENVMYDCSVFSDDQLSFDEVVFFSKI